MNLHKLFEAAMKTLHVDIYNDDPDENLDKLTDEHAKIVKDWIHGKEGMNVKHAALRAGGDELQLTVEVPEETDPMAVEDAIYGIMVNKLPKGYSVTAVEK